MNSKAILLVNPNFMRPPIAPLGLEYVAETLADRGHAPVLCDLAFVEDWPAAIEAALGDVRPAACLITVRNIDDAYFASRDFVLERTRDVVRHVQAHFEGPIVLGGVGFSTAPREVLEYLEADYGVWGEGEATGLLMQAISSGDVSRAPGAVYRDGGGKVRANASLTSDGPALRTVRRTFLDNARYFREGGQAGIESKRGCAKSCIYCVEPRAKGCVVRVREPASVVEEMRTLVEQGVDVFHFCDSEFNIPTEHALALCDAIVKTGLAPHVRWYVYAYPQGVDAALAQAMARAGCGGVNFGVDHLDPGMLRNLGRTYTYADVQQATEACKQAGIPVMLDVLLGGPGETGATLADCIARLRTLPADRIGLSCGVRVYPHTPLARLVQAFGSTERNPHLHGATQANPDLLRPIFYVDAGIDGDIHDAVSDLVDNDARFLHANPNRTEGNYNYNDNRVLEDAIARGERGAYWDILRRLTSA
ncbi:MAG: B12-binding domain-containing radical SAM protein [Candidatus Hydrogenedentota bacterium]